MLCKNCGKELPIPGKFCPFCGASIETTSVQDETTFFTSLPEDLEGPIDTSAFDAAMRDVHQMIQEDTVSDPLAPTDPHIPTPEELSAAQRPRSSSTPHTTRFSAPQTEEQPYHKPSKGKKGAIIALVVVLIAALIGGGVWFFLSRRPDENLTLAEKYMKRGEFDKALTYFQAAQDDARDPASLNNTIQLLQDFAAAKAYVDNQQYTEALVALKQLQNRVTDPDAPMYTAIEEMIEKAQNAQSDEKFTTDIQEAAGYLADKKYDAAAGKLDSLAADDSLTDEQRKQDTDLQKQLTEAQESEKRQEENQQQQAEQKQAFSARIDTQEGNDQKIAAAKTPEEELELTATSFEAWDSLLNDMYTHLATVLNADQYAAEEANYKSWIEERDKGAENAASQSEDKTAAQLAAASFKQSYTKARCYKLLDMM